MWPLSRERLLEELTSSGATLCASGPLYREDVVGEDLGHGEVGGATGSLRDLERGDLFVALPYVDGDAHTHVEEALGSGAALALVAETWAGLGALRPELRARCVTAPDVLACFRAFAARFRRTLACPVVAVIGSNGKTTTKEMIAALLASPGKRVAKTPDTDNGFIGLPQTLCAREHRASTPPDALVLEIGIDAIGAMEQHAQMAAPDVAVVTALGPEHLDGLCDVDTAIAEELRLFEAVPSARRVVLWTDEEIQRRRALVRRQDVAVIEEGNRSGETPPCPAESVLSFHRVARGASSVVAFRWYEGGDHGTPAWTGQLDVPLPGAHNATNFALALAAALSLGRTPRENAAGWATFEAPPWRSQLHPLARGALLYDDCFNASPLSVRAAALALSDPEWAGRPKVLVLGDMLGLGAESPKWHVELADVLASLEGASLFLFGPAMSALARALRDRGAGERVRAIEDDHRDPADLVADMDLPPRAVVLVKGSRRTRMERVARYLQLRWSLGAPARAEVIAQVTPVLVTGSYGVAETVAAVASALRAFGPGAGRLDRSGASVDGHPLSVPPGTDPRTELFLRCIASGGAHAAIEVPHADIATPAVVTSAAVAVLTGFSEADLPPGKDVETHLAEKAQLFLRVPGLRAAILNADDPASDLLAEVIPPHVRVLRAGTRKASGRVDLRATRIAVAAGRATVDLSGGPDFPASIEVAGEAIEFVRAAMAALLVVLALRGSPRMAARHLC